ncbi:putative riboflavin biosynthesis protein Rib7 [Trichodelitschia bisporula]|uniref:2,5-diamino-6-ribosylamino-4(3H)-pyrimidinone 5'-phosphate reductase n=1 Tax=Trichodelitschia bisporula TaxID=703511 RepID=A0A6G1HW01_9PEZI|nr:putative riboflavin biosynthesis protein Rib7 [Trichodelitschia bisporula]
MPPKPPLVLPPDVPSYLSPFLPSLITSPSSPFLTLTYATSLDSALSFLDSQTPLSGPETKAMTHYLRTKHQAILIGANTAVIDDPALNARLPETTLSSQPRPIILDPRGRWDVSRSQVLALARAGRGKAPWVITRKATSVPPEWEAALQGVGGQYIRLASSPDIDDRGRIKWRDIMSALAECGIESVMVEGGASVINGLLAPENINFVGAVVVTLAPVWLGEGGVAVAPGARHNKGVRVPVARLKDVVWRQFGQDVVMCGRVRGD